jgi:hypothetical protein
MKYRFLKLSVFSFTTCFLAVPVNADVVNLSKENVSTDHIEQLTRTLALGGYNNSDDINPPAVSESGGTGQTIYLLKENDGKSLLTNKNSRYSHLKVEKKTYYPDSNIHTFSKFKTPSWSINCEKKKFDNMKICYMNEGDLWVFLTNGRYSVSVGSDHYPGSQGGLKIDNSSVIYGYEGEFPKPSSVIERLKKGKVAYTRYKKWPYEYNKDGEVSLEDFTKKFNEMLKQYKNL